MAWQGLQYFSAVLHHDNIATVFNTITNHKSITVMCPYDIRVVTTLDACVDCIESCSARYGCPLYKEWLNSQSSNELGMVAGVLMRKHWTDADIAECDAARCNEYGPLDPPDEEGYQMPMYPTELYLLGKECDKIASELEGCGIERRIVNSDELRKRWELEDYQSWKERNSLSWEERFGTEPDNLQYVLKMHMCEDELPF